MKRFLSICMHASVRLAVAGAILAIVVLAGSAMVAPAAFAQAAVTTVTAPGALDLTPLFTQLVDNYVTPTLVTIVLALVGWAIGKWASWLPQSTRDSVLAELDTLLEHGAGLVAAKITSMKEFNLHIDNPVIFGIAARLKDEVQPLLTKLGVTPASISDWISRKIVAKLGSASLAEPDHPAPAGAIPGTNVSIDGATIPAVAAPAA